MIMWSVLAMFGIFIGGYFALSYREAMLDEQHQTIQQERIKLD